MSNHSQPNIALVSLPWALFNRPSIQLGALKAYVEQKSSVTIECHHPYLMVAKSLGLETYTYLSKKVWAADALYAGLLFPENGERTRRLFAKTCVDNRPLIRKYETISHILHSSLDTWVSEITSRSYRLIGFSVCFNQLFPSLLAAKKIKEVSPETTIFFGGSSCVGSMGKSIVDVFPQVDLIIEGEGEKTLLDLCNRFFADGKPTIGNESSPRILGSVTSLPLDQLPPPNYHDYFTELQKTFPGMPFSPRLPLEFSRGCWWGKCSFCNLNLQWQGYRIKSAEKVSQEVRTLITRHSCLDFTFCDNALPEQEANTFFSTINKWELDLDFFAEIRTIKTPENLSNYRKGGLSAVQVGIEALSTPLLKKMNKGTTTIENLAIMKQCAEQNITLEGNLIVEFPGSTEKEVQETLQNIDYALPYNPLSAASFFLGAASPIEKQPANYHIQAILPHRNDRLLYPDDILSNMDTLIKGYRGDRARQQKLWKPVREKIGNWQRFHDGRSQEHLPPLSYRDGGTFIVIRQERMDGPPLLHRLTNTSCRLYLACASIVEIEDILAQFSGLKEKTILKFFQDLCNKQLLFCESGKYLALAIRSAKSTSTQ